MPASGCDSFDTCQRGYLKRCGAGCPHGADAEFTVIVGPPSPDSPIVFETEDMIVAAGYSRYSGKTADFDGGHKGSWYSVCGNPPVPERAVVKHRCRTVSVSRNGNYSGQRRYFYRHSAGNVSADAQLAERIVSPGPDRAVIGQGNAVMISGSYGQNPGDSWHLRRDEVLNCSPVIERD